MEKQDYKAIKGALFMSYAKSTAIRLLNLIDKPVQTTKERPKEEDLEMWFEYQKNIQYPIIYSRPNKCIELQLTGMSIYLNPDGTYFLNDTTGG